MRRAQQQTITFPAYDSTVSTGATKTGLTLLNTDVKISKDGAAFASAANAPSEIGSTGRYSLVLTAAETACGWIHVYIEKTGMRPQDVVGAMSDQPAAAVVADGGNSATTFVTDLTSAVTDFWKDALVVFTSGTLAGQVKKVTGYNGTTKALSFATGFTATPGTGDRFILVNS
jgi:hypothetical protein